ncbi:hypothetical protein SSX86_007580 [Deinandra increscens subsp. villosa]|uniref:Replication factor A C-terminal domain-containing protein n=1 Tax=Deinandra increscens subsp. villosa TaxID=3103831 RepID=A0AAP0DDR5_9ASTR
MTNHIHETDVVLVLQYSRFSIFEGGYSITNAFDVTNLFINSEVDEISSFRKSFVEVHGSQPTSPFASLSAEPEYSLENDFLSTEFNHIVELNRVDEIIKVVVLANIKCLNEDSSWFYYSCNACTKIVSKEPNTEATSTSGDLWKFICNTANCKGKKIEATERFKILIKIQDASGLTTMTLMDKESRKLLKISARELMRRSIDRLAFKIDITSFNLDNDYRYYTVSKVTDDVGIIKSLDEKYNFEQSQSQLSGSVNFSSQDIHSQASSSKKDAVSVGDDDVNTLYGGEISDKKSQTRCELTTESKKIDAALKRKLNDVYDVEDSYDQSQPQNLNEVVQDDGGMVKVSLLTPKLEK